MGQTVLILGGGVGGLVAANNLRKALPKEHRVVLVEREASFVFAPSFLWLMTGGRTAEKISRPLARLEKKGIELVRGEIQKIDAERREAVVDGRTLSGDFLIITLGAELAPEAIPGLVEAGHNFYTLRGAPPGEGTRRTAALSPGEGTRRTAALSPGEGTRRTAALSPSASRSRNSRRCLATGTRHNCGDVSLTVTRHDVPIRGLDPAHDGLVIVQLTDIHAGLMTPERRIRRAVDLANAVRPDVIVLTGDYVCYSVRLVDYMGDCIKGLSATCGVVATLGNHDHWAGAASVARVLVRDGYDVLCNQTTVLNPRGASLAIVGVDDAVTRNDDLRRAFAGAPKRATRVVLSHCPEIADDAIAAGAELVLAGHTHGGQLNIRGVTERMFRSLTKRRYFSGWYDLGNGRLYVNRGVGSSALPMRAGAGAKSEVAVFTLRRA